MNCFDECKHKSISCQALLGDTHTHIHTHIYNVFLTVPNAHGFGRLVAILGTGTRLHAVGLTSKIFGWQPSYLSKSHCQPP